MDREPVTAAQLALPVLVPTGLVFGQSIAAALIAPDVPRNNDVAGAGAAMMFSLTVVVGFVVTGLTLAVQRMADRALPNRIALRACTSVVAGAVIGVAAWGTRVRIPAEILLAMLVLAPIALALRWPWDDR